MTNTFFGHDTAARSSHIQNRLRVGRSELERERINLKVTASLAEVYFFTYFVTSTLTHVRPLVRSTGGIDWFI